MKQLSLFPNDPEPTIPGLKYIDSYISKEEEIELLNNIDQNSWLDDLKRRVQHYGYKYDYKNKKIDSSYYLGSIPEWLAPLCNRLLSEGIFKVLPDQVIVNEYLPGQGIASHIDIPCFDETICSISLGSSCLIEFSKNNSKIYQWLEPMSLLALSSEARYEWHHGIAARKYDNYNGGRILRGRRVSLTFRKVVVTALSSRT